MHESWLSPRVKVAPSPVSGRGIFTVASVAAGEPLVVWGGPSYTDRAGAAEARRRGLPVMRWDEDVYSRPVDTPQPEEPFLVNHACDPSAWLVGAFTIVARRELAPGEEVTLDYATFLDDETAPSSWACRCGAANCRGRVAAGDWRDPALRARYRGHFSPHLSRRIAADE